MAHPPCGELVVADDVPQLYVTLVPSAHVQGRAQ
jgi:hypothetical protein